MKCLSTLPETLFVNNRMRCMNSIPNGGIAIFVSNGIYPLNADAVYTFQQNSTLFWLTGITQENTVLVLQPDHANKNLREVLFIQKANPLLEKWNGAYLQPAQATLLSGIKMVLFVEDIQSYLPSWIYDHTYIYLHSNEHERKSENVFPTEEERWMIKLKKEYPLHVFRRSSPIIKQLRSVKTQEEIVAIKEAIAITQITLDRVLQYIHEGCSEYQIEAEIIHAFMLQQATPAYDSIVASGKNACTLHYINNTEMCKSGDLILMDFGARRNNYCADLTRTVPVNGKFSKRQKQVYDACLHLHNYAKSLLKPGLYLSDYTKQVGEEATKKFLEIGLLTVAMVANQDKNNPAYKQFLYHGISHHLGIDVHDIAMTRTQLLEGMVLTVEPGIYIADEGIGIRIENNVVITKDGNEDLMKSFPITTEEIENCMKK